MLSSLSSLKFCTLTKAAIIGVGLMSGATVANTSHAEEAIVQAKSGLRVTIDRAKVVRIAKAADTVIIGNPSVVDATIQDARTLVLTGRNFGTTNLIVLDAEGDAIVDEEVSVVGHEKNLVRIYRRDVRETFTCSPICENTVTVGDQKDSFKDVAEQVQTRNALSSGK